MKAMILAAGLGTRLGTLTQQTPKCLVEAGGKPMIEHAIEALKRAGVSEVVINLYHLAGQVEAYFSTRQSDGVAIHFSHEHELLGTGGGLFHARDFFAGEDAFIVHNADVYSEIDLGAAVAAHRAGGALATLLVMMRESSRTLLFRPDGSLAGWKTKGAVQVSGFAGEDALDSLAFSGIQILSGGIFRYMEGEKPPFSTITSFLKAAGQGERVCAFRTAGEYWIDAGTPECLEALRQHLGVVG